LGDDSVVPRQRATIAERISAQGLSGEPLRDVAAVPGLLLAVQGQDPRGARLAVRARSEGLSAADVDHAFTEERSVLITWLNRGTLHLVRREDYPLLQSLTTPPLFTGNARRLRQEGVSEAAAERALGLIELWLADEGPLSGPELRERLTSADVPTAGQAFIHLMFLAALRGLVVRGPMQGKQHAYALVEDWLGPQRPPERDAALAELARRYLAGHGPADERDLARWAGLPLRDARAGLGAIADELVQRPDGLVDLAGRERSTALPLRPAAARLDLARGDRRPAQAARHQQRHLPTVRPGRRACRRDLGLRRRQGNDRATRQGDEEGRGGAGG